MYKRKAFLARFAILARENNVSGRTLTGSYYGPETAPNTNNLVDSGRRIPRIVVTLLGRHDSRIFEYGLDLLFALNVGLSSPRPEGTQIAQSNVAVLDKGIAIACELRLALTPLGGSESGNIMLKEYSFLPLDLSAARTGCFSRPATDVSVIFHETRLAFHK